MKWHVLYNVQYLYFHKLSFHKVVSKIISIWPFFLMMILINLFVYIHRVSHLRRHIKTTIYISYILCFPNSVQSFVLWFYRKKYICFVTPGHVIFPNVLYNFDNRTFCAKRRNFHGIIRHRATIILFIYWSYLSKRTSQFRMLKFKFNLVLI